MATAGWQVMGTTLRLVAPGLGLLGLVILGLRSRDPKRRQPQRIVDDRMIVATYNRALLSGARAGEEPTFRQVAEQTGTSAEHVRAVIARFWRA